MSWQKYRKECFFTEQLPYRKHCAKYEKNPVHSCEPIQKKMRKSKPQFDSERLPEHILRGGGGRTLAQLALNHIHFPDCNRGAEELFSSLLLQGEVDYCCRTNPGRPLTVRKQPLSLTLLPRRGGHYRARNFNLGCLDCCWQPAAPSLALPPSTSLFLLCWAALTSKHFEVVNKSASQTGQASPTPARNCRVQFRDKNII